MFSMQETFDLVVGHLRKQGCKSTRFSDDGGNACAYRGDEGKKCAVGFLIPDEKYDQDMEGLLATDEPIQGMLNEQGHNVDLCRELQRVHDHYSPAPEAWFNSESTWEAGFKTVATIFNLEYKEPEYS